jgi:hypothetical protein
MLWMGAGLLLASQAAAQTVMNDAVQADKRPVVEKAMALTDAEARAFWPVYDAFQKELAKLYDRRHKLIAAYADAYKKGPLPDAVARKLIAEASAIEGDEHALKRSYIDKFSKVLPGAKVLRYLLVENKINSAVQFQISNGLPLPQ